jgi:hypothetical protein
MARKKITVLRCGDEEFEIDHRTVGSYESFLAWERAVEAVRASSKDAGSVAGVLRAEIEVLREKCAKLEERLSKHTPVGRRRAGRR